MLRTLLVEQEKKLVRMPLIIETDESVFHANDDRQGAWVRANDPNPTPPPKTEGAGIMALVFLTEHGEVKLTDEELKAARLMEGEECDGESRFMLKIGKNREGYLDSARYLDVVKKMLKIVKIKYPYHKPVLIVDQSSVHLRYADNAIRIEKINLKDDTEKKHAKRVQKAAANGAVLPRMRDGSYAKGGRKVAQSFHFDDGRRKGGTMILDERGVKPPENIRKWTVETMRKALAEQDDFKAETSELQHLVEDAGGILLISPKYHCEFNPCELAWGTSKRFARIFCSYNLPGLEKIVKKTFDLYTPEMCKKWFEHTEAWRKAYADGAQNGTEAKVRVKLGRKVRQQQRADRGDQRSMNVVFEHLGGELLDQQCGADRNDDDTAEGSRASIPYEKASSHRQINVPRDLQPPYYDIELMANGLVAEFMTGGEAQVSKA